MKLNVLGGSGSGTTSLASALVGPLSTVHLDADAYYWRPSDPPFQHKVSAEVRRENLSRDFASHPRVALSGSMCTWGSSWSTAFDLVVFLLIPQALRMERLASRERDRYGDRLQRDPQLAERSHAFLDWARRYDDPTFEGRSRQQHEQWLATVPCPIVRIEGDTTVAQRVERVVHALA